MTFYIATLRRKLAIFGGKSNPKIVSFAYLIWLGLTGSKANILASRV